MSESNAHRLAGKVAVVTGGNRGIGRAIAERLAADGAAVAILGRTQSELDATAEAMRAAGGRVLEMQLDVTDREAVPMVMDRVEETLGPIDVLVNNAGVLSAIGPAWELDPDDFSRDLLVNVHGVFLCCRAVVPRMIQRGGGRIINMVGGGTKGVFPFASAYGASKAALQRWTETLDDELRQEHPEVRAFAVNPGLVHTAMTAPALTDSHASRWLPDQARRLQSGEHLPPQRAAELVRDIACGVYDRLRGRFLNAELPVGLLLRRMDELAESDLLRLGIVEPVE